MTLLEWEKRTYNMCHGCRSREFNSLSPNDRDKLIEEVGSVYEILERVR